MATPLLILRFKEFNAELNTVSEHNKIILAKGRVLWGWWRKDHELDQEDKLRNLVKNLPFEVRLVNRDAKKLFRAAIRNIFFPADSIDSELIPSYYRKYASDINVWFEFDDNILEIEYDGELASQIGSQTPVFSRGSFGPRQVMPVVEIASIDKNNNVKIRPVLAHISDLHYGPDDHNFLMPPDTASISGPQIDLTTAISRDYYRIDSKPPGVLVISGDITSKNYWKPQYRDRIVATMKDLTKQLKLVNSQIIIGPGNHDVERPEPSTVDASDLNVKRAINYEHEENFRTFLHEFTGRDRKSPLSSCHTVHCDKFNIKIGSLNSANLGPTKFSEYGYVGSGPLDDILKEMNDSTLPAIKILVLHHHLIPISSVELQEKVGVTMTLDANDILRRAQEAGVQLILHGHQHTPRIIKYAQAYIRDNQCVGLDKEDLYIVAGGSAGSRELQPGTTNTYTYIKFGERNTKIVYRKLSSSGQELGNLMTVTLPIRPK